MVEFFELLQPLVYSEIVSHPIEGDWPARFQSDRTLILFFRFIHRDHTSETMRINCTRAGFIQ